MTRREFSMSIVVSFADNEELRSDTANPGKQIYIRKNYWQDRADSRRLNTEPGAEIAISSGGTRRALPHPPSKLAMTPRRRGPRDAPGRPSTANSRHQEQP